MRIFVPSSWRACSIHSLLTEIGYRSMGARNMQVFLGISKPCMCCQCSQDRDRDCMGDIASLNLNGSSCLGTMFYECRFMCTIHPMPLWNVSLFLLRGMPEEPSRIGAALYALLSLCHSDSFPACWLPCRKAI